MGSRYSSAPHFGVSGFWPGQETGSCSDNVIFRWVGQTNSVLRRVQELFVGNDLDAREMCVVDAERFIDLTFWKVCRKVRMTDDENSRGAADVDAVIEDRAPILVKNF